MAFLLYVHPDYHRNFAFPPLFYSPQGHKLLNVFDIVLLVQNDTNIILSVMNT
jgi:hypothetical protein